MFMRLRSVPYGWAFRFKDSDKLYAHHGNGWHQVYGKTETGGPWHSDAEQWVRVEPKVSAGQELGALTLG